MVLLIPQEGCSLMVVVVRKIWMGIVMHKRLVYLCSGYQ